MDGLVLFAGDVFSPSVESSVTRGSHMVRCLGGGAAVMPRGKGASPSRSLSLRRRPSRSLQSLIPGTHPQRAQTRRRVHR
jgi:hypothetical protein